MFALLAIASTFGACRSASRVSVSEGPAVDSLRPLVGQKLVLRHFGDQATAAVKPGETAKGTCDVAVEVKEAADSPGGVRFVLGSLGRVRVGDEPTVGRCRRLVSPITLTVRGTRSQSGDWRPTLDTVLLTPDAYLAAHRRTASPAPEAEPKTYANNSAVTDDEGRRLARRLTAWPKPLFSIEPAVASGSSKVKHEGEIEFSAVVGADGRVFKPKVKTSLNDAHTEQVQTVLGLWRFEPAREGDKAAPALYEGRTVFRLY